MRNYKTKGGSFLNIIICDDIKRDRVRLKRLLQQYEINHNIKFVITEFHSGEELCTTLSCVQNSQIIFLDINMAEMDGLKTAVQIKKQNPQIHIVLVTAFLNYALDGYKVKASRFLLKDDLEKTITECMDDLLAEIYRNKRTLVFSFVEGEKKLRIEDIIYIETYKHKNFFHTKTGVFSIYQKLDEIEMNLKEFGFLRIHKSFLVNMRHIQKISSYIMTLKDGRELSVPKARYPFVKQQYALFKGAE